MTCTHQQIDLFESINPAGSRTSVSSGHGTGKTRAIGITALWHLLCYFLSNTMLTAPKIEQVRNTAWKEITDIKDLVRAGPHGWIADYFEVEAERVYVKGYKQQWFIIAKTAPRGSPENLAGMHRDWYLVIADEASGIPDNNYTVLTGALTDARNRMLLTSQPTRNVGFFYDTHHSLSKAEGGPWNALVFNSEESPRVSDEFIRDKKLEYTDVEYQIKVLGRFPENMDGFLLGRSQLEACFDKEVIGDGLLYGFVASADVGAGEYRDKSILVLAKVSGYGDFGPDARRVQVFGIPIITNTRIIQDFTGDVFHQVAEIESATTLVDAGGMGVAVCQGLETKGLPNVIRVKWGNSCFGTKNKERFFNLRAQAMVHASRAAKEGRLGIVSGPWRKDILDQGSRIPYHFDEKARYVIEKKEDMRAAGIPSPDIWDAICFLFLEDANYIIAESSSTPEVVTKRDEARKEAEDMFAHA